MPAETTTSPPTQTHIGTARTSSTARVRDWATASVAKADLAQPRRKDGRVLSVHADVGGGGGDLVQHALLDDRPARERLERCRVRLGDQIDPVLALNQLASARAHRRADIRVGERLQRSDQRVLLALIDRYLQ